MNESQKVLIAQTLVLQHKLIYDGDALLLLLTHKKIGHLRAKNLKMMMTTAILIGLALFVAKERAKEEDEEVHCLDKSQHHATATVAHKP